jgi:SpoVK/Ycf46/Vps4 family AAA+-type ATPase
MTTPTNEIDEPSQELVGSITFLSLPALPLLSLSIQIQSDEKVDDDILSPLLFTCIKRQLIGCPILWSNKANTLFTIQDSYRMWNCQVQAVQFESQHISHPFSLGVVYPSTRITIQVEKEEDQSPLYSVTTTTTLSPAARLLRETLHCLQAGQFHVPRYFLWTGPPGVGKTYSVQQVLPWCQCHNVRGNLSSVLPTLTKENSRKPNLIFLDECEAMASNDEGAATLAYWLDEWSYSSTPLVVVAATNRVDDLPASLRRRFHKEMHFMPPSAEERCTIFQQLLQKWWPATDLTTEDLREVADLCVGYVAADLVALVRQASLAHMMDSDNSGPSTETPNRCKGYLLRAMEQVGASALRDAAMTAPLTTTGWDDIAGEAGGAKKALRQAIDWPRTKRDAYELLGLTPPRGILLHGPPGCAKTSLARAAAGAAGVAFVSLAPADVYASSYVGDAEAIVRRSFDLARSAAPCVLFFDEIDAILGVMSDDGNVSAGGLARGHSAEARVLSTFLNEMDGVDGSWKDGVLVLGATNRPWTLDAALMRPGRFDKIIYVPPPDTEGRRAIFEMQTRNWRANSTAANHDPIDIDYLAIDKISGNMTGAEIKGACQEAAMHALRQFTEGKTSEPIVRQRDLLHALSLVKPLLSDPFQMENFRLFESKRRNCT